LEGSLEDGLLVFFLSTVDFLGLKWIDDLRCIFFVLLVGLLAPAAMGESLVGKIYNANSASSS
jgi:hypothetical protein